MAYPNDMSRLADGITAEQASRTDFSSSANAAKTGRRLIRKTYTIGPTAAVNANGNNAVVANGNGGVRMPVAGRVLAAYALFFANATAATTDNATIAVLALAANGWSGNAVASITSNTSANSGTGNIVKGVPVSITLNDLANTRYAAGTVLAPQVSQNGNGVAMGAGNWSIEVEEESAVDGYK